MEDVDAAEGEWADQRIRGFDADEVENAVEVEDADAPEGTNDPETASEPEAADEDVGGRIGADEAENADEGIGSIEKDDANE